MKTAMTWRKMKYITSGSHSKNQGVSAVNGNQSYICTVTCIHYIKKSGSGHKVQTPASTSTETTASKISPTFREILQTPQPKRKATTTCRSSLNMPKHMTGEEFIKLMEQKKQEKDEEEAAKKRRKLEREEKKKEKQMVKEEKAKSRQVKKLLAAQKKAKDLAIRNAKRLARQMKKSTVTHPLPQFECCVECGKAENSNEEWVSCDNCGRWWHECTDTPGKAENSCLLLK